MIRIGIAGYGNIGRGVEAAVTNAPDMEIAAVFTRRDPSSVSTVTNAKVMTYDDMDSMKDDVDVMIICAGSATDLPWMSPEIAGKFNIVDSFDNHTKIPEHFKNVDEAAKAAGSANSAAGKKPRSSSTAAGSGSAAAKKPAGSGSSAAKKSSGSGSAAAKKPSGSGSTAAKKQSASGTTGTGKKSGGNAAKKSTRSGSGSAKKKATGSGVPSGYPESAGYDGGPGSEERF